MIQWIVGVIAAAYILSGFRIVRPTERGLVETFGKYKRFADPGLTYIFFGIQRLTKINVTEYMVDAKPQQIITKDKLNAIVDAQVYFKVKSDETSVKASQYNVHNYDDQIVQLARTTLRNIIGTLSLNDANSSRDKINGALMKTLSEETKHWGLEVVRTELKEIEPPQDVQETMNEVVKAENEKIAAIDFATAKETQADGERRAEIKRAEGRAQAVQIEAKAQADAIRLVNDAADKHFKGNAIKLKQLEVTQKSLENNAKIIITKDGVNPLLLLGDSEKKMKQLAE
ncbi:MAG TPA: SPFH domain-containing protein [Candidatus Nanoarchaeia archaeon]|nr:SPFH domain-containing protein [Candidatus Nanoarchaeia archaeon]